MPYVTQNTDWLVKKSWSLSDYHGGKRSHFHKQPHLASLHCIQTRFCGAQVTMTASCLVQIHQDTRMRVILNLILSENGGRRNWLLGLKMLSILPRFKCLWHARFNGLWYFFSYFEFFQNFACHRETPFFPGQHVKGQEKYKHCY